jgi:hypothetical protein
MASTRKTGEPQRSKQPLSIDRLPQVMLDRIQKERSESGKSWSSIEAESPNWKEWNDVPSQVLELFPDLRLPHSNLQRWWDLRIAQVRTQVLAETEQARALAESFKDREFKDADKAVVNAIRDQVFSMLHSVGDQKQFLKQLKDFGWLLAQFKKVEVQQKKVQLDERKVEMAQKKLDKLTNDAAKQLEKGKPVTLDDINKIRERTFGLPPVQR